MRVEQLGRHILVELYDCDRDILSDHDRIEAIMNEAALRSKATIVKSVFHRFNPYGVSGAVIIAESHLSIHTWPEYGYAAVDLFVCGDSVDPWVGFEYLSRALMATKWETSEVPRGTVDKIKSAAGITGRINYKPEKDV